MNDLTILYGEVIDSIAPCFMKILTCNLCIYCFKISIHRTVLSHTDDHRSICIYSFTAYGIAFILLDASAIRVILYKLLRFRFIFRKFV